MADQLMDSPVEVRDNGIRSFIPPTFCFDLLNPLTGILVTTVSQLVLGAVGFSQETDFEALEILTRRQLLTTGLISDYDAGPQAREPGRRS